MKYIKTIFLFIILLSLNLGAAEQLILHFDVNGTLTAVDSIEKMSTHDEINSRLSEKYKGYWDANQVEEMTFRDYVYTILIPDEKTEGAKEQRSWYLKNFVRFLEEHQHPLFEEVNSEYCILYEKLAKGDVFPSFFKLVDFLESNKINYTIHLRSFGKDLSPIANEINKTLGKDFFKNTVIFQDGNLLTQEGVLTSSTEVYDYLKSHGNLTIQDNWSWWNSHQKNSQYGKPFYLKNSDDVAQIFFDDNIRLNSNDINIIGPFDVETNSAVNIDELIADKRAVRVDTLEAIKNDDYFIEFVRLLLNLNCHECPK